MIIEHYSDKRNVMFADVEAGTVIRSEHGKYHIKVSNFGGVNYNAVRLCNGVPVSFNSDTLVTIVRAKLIVED